MFVLLVLYKLIQNLNSLNRPFKQSLANRKTNSPKKIKITPYLTTYRTTCTINMFYRLLVD
jgi:hypothetical protein